MPAKQGVMMDDKKKNLFQDIKGNIVTFRRKVLRLYLQYINPKLGKVVEVTNEPGDFFRRLLPVDIAKWIAISAAITGLLVLFKPEAFLYWQIALFLAIFFLGPVLVGFINLLKSKFYNLHVAYPGKHLLDQDFQMEQPIVDGIAEMELHGETWTISGSDCAAGARVRVIAIKDGVLFVAPVEQ